MVVGSSPAPGAKKKLDNHTPTWYYIHNERLQAPYYNVKSWAKERGRECPNYWHVWWLCKMVQVGTQLYKEGPDVFVRLQNELISILKEKNYNSLSEFRGKLKTIS